MGDIMSRRGRLEPSDNWLGLVGFLLLVLATLDDTDPSIQNSTPDHLRRLKYKCSIYYLFS